MLIPKSKALEVLAKHQKESCPSASDAKGDPQSQPLFVEVLANMGLFIAKHAKDQILNPSASPDDLRTLQRYVKCCTGALREELDAALETAMTLRSNRLRNAMSSRGTSPKSSRRASEAGDVQNLHAGTMHEIVPWLLGCEDDHQLAEVKKRAWEKQQQQQLDKRLEVIAR